MDFGAIFYPTLLICFFFTIILAVGVGFSYIWLKIMDKQLRKCPECGQTGSGYIRDTEVIETQNHMDYKRYPPSRVTVQTLEDVYECEVCKHTWTKRFEETTRTQIKVER